MTPTPPQEATITHHDDPPFERVITLEHKIIDGAHIFTSPDLFGLAVIAPSLERAKAQLRHVIEELVKRNEGFSVSVSLGAINPQHSKEPQFAILKRAA